MTYIYETDEERRDRVLREREAARRLAEAGPEPDPDPICARCDRPSDRLVDLGSWATPDRLCPACVRDLIGGGVEVPQPMESRP